MKYEITEIRTYETTIKVDAGSIEELQKNYIDNGHIYNEELAQCEVSDEEISIKPLNV